MDVAEQRPTWILVLDAVDRLTKSGEPSFRLRDIVSEIQRVHPEIPRSTIQPVVQGMTVNAGKGPTSPCGKVLTRVARGVYQHTGGSARPALVRAPPVRRASDSARRLSRSDLGARTRDVIARFDECVRLYDEAPPFTRFDQFEAHRRTIDRRLAVTGVEEAILDDTFTELLYTTLLRWGIGRRRSVLVPLPQFRLALRANLAPLRDLERIHIHTIAGDPRPVASAVADLIANLGVVENQARIVPGTKTLHHLLPDLVPPMDREWTARFFGWNAFEMQYGQADLILEAFATFAQIAAATSPQRFVGPAWRTSVTKVLDNALIGYLRLTGVQPGADGAPQ